MLIERMELFSSTYIKPHCTHFDIELFYWSVFVQLIQCLTFLKSGIGVQETGGINEMKLNNMGENIGCEHYKTFALIHNYCGLIQAVLFLQPCMLNCSSLSARHILCV